MRLCSGSGATFYIYGKFSVLTLKNIIRINLMVIDLNNNWLELINMKILIKGKVQAQVQDIN